MTNDQQVISESSRRAAAVARRFERDCRRFGHGLSVRPSTESADVTEPLPVRAANGDDTAALTISGLDEGSWDDPGGVEALSRVVGVLLGGTGSPRVPGPVEPRSPRPSAGRPGGRPAVGRMPPSVVRPGAVLTGPPGPVR